MNSPMLRCSVTALSALLLLGCGQKPTEIRLTPTKNTVYGLGERLLLATEILDKKGQAVPGVVVVYESSNPKVASVDGQGTVKSIGPGKTMITVKGGDLSAQANVEVVDVRDISLDPPRLTLAGAKGTTTQLRYEIHDSKDKVLDLKPNWTTSDPNVATVDDKGLVSSVNPGRATLSATLGKISASCDVSVVFREIGSLDLMPKTVILKVGEQMALTALVKDANGGVIENAAVLWTVSDPRVVRNLNGILVGASPGAATVGAEVGTFKSEVSILVN
ncbi:MAG: Ig-like domain-containing protein [Acidobacteria bacterium]|nr:Ig-like domain-containing protein [Acidobacteriota bacterium]